MLFLERLLLNCRKHGQKTAIEFRGESGTERISYDALCHRVRATAAALADRGVGRGDRVAVYLPKSLAAIELHLAACSMGAVSMPLNPAYSASELKYLLEDSGAKVLIAPQAGPGAATAGRLALDATTRVFGVGPEGLSRRPDTASSHLDAVQRSHEAPALMLYTSGTTGRPKGAVMSHGSLTANIEMLGKAWQWSPDDVLLHMLPLFHVHGLLVALHGALQAGATAIVRPSFEASIALRDLGGRDCTVFMAVPTMYRRLLAELGTGKLDLGHMRLLTSGSDRLPVEVFEAIDERLGHRVVERYGMTETGIMLSNPLDGARIPGQVGIPLPGVEMRTVNEVTGKPCEHGEVGELQTRGPHVFSGYWNDPDKTSRSFTSDGWFRTGDLGLRDSRGRFELKGRMTDLIITGGFNVYPTEVEHVLARHRGVLQCAVAGVPDADWGEAVTAFVVRGDASTTAEDLIRHSRASLAAYKSPKRVVFVDAFPRNAMGKVQKKVLVSELAAPTPKSARG